MTRILLIADSLYPQHSTSWTHAWKKILEEADIPFALSRWNASDLLDQMDHADTILHALSHFNPEELRINRQLLIAAEMAGKRVFPGLHELWTFDDKIAQTAFFKFTKLSHPTTILLLNDEVSDPMGDTLDLPVIHKLGGGSGSYNVTKLKTQEEVQNTYRKMFSGGLASRPKFWFKIWSAIKSVRSATDFFVKFGRASDFKKSYSIARNLPVDRNYLYLQEFVPEARFDLKIAVVNDKLSYLCRHIRPNDFRASGSNDIYYDHNLITVGVVEECVSAYKKMNMICAGFDVVMAPETGKAVILEVSYGFSYAAIAACRKYYDLKTGTWIDESLDVPKEVLRALNVAI